MGSPREWRGARNGVGIDACIMTVTTTTNMQPGLGDWLDQGIIYLHIMALHAEREHFGFCLGVGTFVLPLFLFLSFLLLLS